MLAAAAAAAKRGHREEERENRTRYFSRDVRVLPRKSCLIYAKLSFVFIPSMPAAQGRTE